MSVESNKQNTQVIMDMFAGKQPLDRVADYIAPGIVDHQLLPGIDTQGIDGFRRVVEVFHSAFPDIKMDSAFMLAEGDLVAQHFRVTGTNTGSFAGMPPTGRSIDMEGVDILRFGADGKAVEHWGYMEESKMMQQLGLMPEH